MTNWVETERDADAWAQLWDGHPFPLQQSAIYGDALVAFGARPRCLEWGRDDGAPRACVQVVERKAFGFFTAAIAFWGPHWRGDISEDEKFVALKALSRRYPKIKARFLSLMPHASETDEENSRLMRRLGLRRTITGYGTVWLDLGPDLETLRAQLKGKWRNALVAAEGSALEVREGGRKPHQYAWLIEKEGAQRLDVRYSGLPTEFIDAWAFLSTTTKDHSIFALAAMAEGKRVAGQLYLLHGNTATYMIGWNGDAGRRYSAHNLLTWHAVTALKDRGLSYIDMGGLNTEPDGAGIARFKLGLGTAPYIYAGTYV